MSKDDLDNTIVRGLKAGISPEQALEMYELKKAQMAEQEAQKESLSHWQQIKKATLDWIVQHWIQFLAFLSSTIAAGGSIAYFSDFFK